MGQAPSAVVLVRPHRFRPNPDTTVDNEFQRTPDSSAEAVAQRASQEVTLLGATLQEQGVGVTMFEDLSEATPDSVFPNNWFSTHASGDIALYPMLATNRRAERRRDVLDRLAEHFEIRRIVDYSLAEHRGRFLEGTGVMVLDHEHRLAYACRSRRMDAQLLASFCADFGYEPVVFDATAASGAAVYHTNVMLCVGTEVALIAGEMIRDCRQRGLVRSRLAASGKHVVELTEHQVAQFAGNALELHGRDGRFLVMSARGFASLDAGQRAELAGRCPVVTVPVPTIETAGGSVRCMIAGIHLPAIADQSTQADRDLSSVG